MAHENFDRTYTIEIGRRGKTGFKIGNLESVEQPTLHVSFSVEKSDTESSNTADVSIWNLSPQNLKILDQKDPVIYLRAGYGNENALILAGDITSVTTERDNADMQTKLEVADGMVALRDTYLTISKMKKVGSKAIYTQIAKKMGCTIKFAKGLKFKKIPHGFSYVGKAKNALSKVAKTNGHSWSIQNGIIHVTEKGKAMNTEGYLISEDTGLIDVPKKVTISSSSSSTSSETSEISGWEIKFFLNGAIGVGDSIKLKSNVVSGYFYVQKITFDGDNVSGDWTCTAQIIKLVKKK